MDVNIVCNIGLSCIYTWNCYEQTIHVQVKTLSMHNYISEVVKLMT